MDAPGIHKRQRNRLQGWYPRRLDAAVSLREDRAMRHVVTTPQDAEGGIILAEHLLGSVTIPRVLELVQDEGPVRANVMRWSVIKDLRNRVLDFRGCESHEFRAVRLPRLDLRPEEARAPHADGRRDHRRHGRPQALSEASLPPMIWQKVV
jgi:hypothetical protein